MENQVKQALVKVKSQPTAASFSKPQPLTAAGQVWDQ
jgi:hypothetical protein